LYVNALFGSKLSFSVGRTHLPSVVDAKV
jgi:hypothetical protein